MWHWVQVFFGNNFDLSTHNDESETQLIKPRSAQDMWHWVQVFYGNNFDLSTDNDESQTQLIKETAGTRGSLPSEVERVLLPIETPPAISSKDLPLVASGNLLEEDKNLSPTESQTQAVPSTCPVKHEGRMVMRQTYPLPVDTLFTLLFTHNQFSKNLTESLKYTDVNATPWEEDVTTGLKTRTCTLVVPVTQPIGPKTCNVKETQVIQACSKPGQLCVIEVENVNSGVPYCDSFYITTHYCIVSDANGDSIFTVHCQIKYRKSVWALVKNFIEKNVWVGLQEYFQAMGKSLDDYCSTKHTVDGKQMQSRESSKVTTTYTLLPDPDVEPVKSLVTHTQQATLTSNTNAVSDIALWVVLGTLALLLLSNIILYYKLSALQQEEKDYTFLTTLDTRLLHEQPTNEHWLMLLHKQASQHQKEILLWKKTLQSVISLLKKAEDSAVNLQSHILADSSDRVLKAVNSLWEPHNKVQTEL